MARTIPAQNHAPQAWSGRAAAETPDPEAALDRVKPGVSGLLLLHGQAPAGSLNAPQQTTYCCISFTPLWPSAPGCLTCGTAEKCDTATGTSSKVGAHAQWSSRCNW
jgi:hypothetical protein